MRPSVSNLSITSLKITEVVLYFYISVCVFARLCVVSPTFYKLTAHVLFCDERWIKRHTKSLSIYLHITSTYGSSIMSNIEYDSIPHRISNTLLKNAFESHFKYNSWHIWYLNWYSSHFRTRNNRFWKRGWVVYSFETHILKYVYIQTIFWITFRFVFYSKSIWYWKDIRIRFRNFNNCSRMMFEFEVLTLGSVQGLELMEYFSVKYGVWLRKIRCVMFSGFPLGFWSTPRTSKTSTQKWAAPRHRLAKMPPPPPSYFGFGEIKPTFQTID